MSQVKMERIWQHQQVLPYIFIELKQKIEVITPIKQIYLYGSRARTPIADWQQLEGKDWDIIVLCAFPIINTNIWTIDQNYHIDLKITTADYLQHFKDYKIPLVQLFPVNELKL